MTLFLYSAVLLSFLARMVVAIVCPILGPVFPAPKHPSASPALKTALETLKPALDDAFATGNNSFGPVNADDTFSIQIFSAAEEEILFEYYHAGANLTVDGIDGDSVYRIGSTTKLLTTYLLLIEAGGHAIFSDPVTKYVHELQDPVWEEITVGALAGMIAGVVADLYDVSTIAGGNMSAVFPGVFPSLEENDISPCILNLTHCTRAEFIEELERRPFVYAPYTTPAYSNSGFALLGYVLESLTGSSYDDVFQRSLVEPLGLIRTFPTTPDPSFGAIAFNETYSGWNIDISEATAMGGAFSSANDLSTIGRAILGSTQLRKSTTRAWMKPTAHTSSLVGAVGRPWEIYRAVTDAENNRLVDIYAKGGNVGIYDAQFALLPDFGAGFVTLHARLTGLPSYGVTSLISDILIPALDEAAREEADAAFAGTYRASNGINSSITLSTSAGTSGLVIEQWIQNSTNMLDILASAPDDEYRMYPSNRDETRPDVTYVSSWKMVTEVGFGFEVKGPFGACPTWFAVDRPGWGRFALDDFEFQLGSDGVAKSVVPKALQIQLEREN